MNKIMPYVFVCLLSGSLLSYGMQRGNRPLRLDPRDNLSLAQEQALGQYATRYKLTHRMPDKVYYLLRALRLYNTHAPEYDIIKTMLMQKRYNVDKGNVDNDIVAWIMDRFAHELDKYPTIPEKIQYLRDEYLGEHSFDFPNAEPYEVDPYFAQAAQEGINLLQRQLDQEQP